MQAGPDGDTKWFFGGDPSPLAEYAWFKDNAGGKSHPVGQKKPNPWGFYDIYGNVCERISDKYHKDYYAKSPKTDPTGPKQAIKSRFGYKVTAAKAGKYSLEAKVVTANYDQRIKVSANEGQEIAMKMPFTEGVWQSSQPVEITLVKGENLLELLARRTTPKRRGDQGIRPHATKVKGSFGKI